MQYTAFIFDFDGTMFDTRSAIAAAIIQTFHERECPRPSESTVWSTIRRGTTLEETFKYLLPTGERVNIENWVFHYRKIYNGGLGVSESHPYAGIIELVKELVSRPEPIIVCSNKGRQAVENSLAHHDILPAVSLIVAADGPAATKPDPKSFFNCIKPAIGRDASKAPLVIGDTDADIRYAHSIGADVCWASYGYGDPGKCESLGPTYIARKPSDLAEFVSHCSSAGVRMAVENG